MSHQRSMNMEAFKHLKAQLRKAYRDEEAHWRQQSKTTWMKLGDKNSKYFHATAKQRKANNRIHVLIDEETGAETFDEDEMGDLAVRHFTNLYTSDLRDSDSNRNAAIFRNFPTKISDLQNAALLSPVEDEEIRRVVFSMGADKCPGPDGLSGAFYQDFWNTIKPKVTCLVKDFMTTGAFDNRLNETCCFSA